MTTTITSSVARVVALRRGDAGVHVRPAQSVTDVRHVSSRTTGRDRKRGTRSRSRAGDEHHLISRARGQPATLPVTSSSGSFVSAEPGAQVPWSATRASGPTERVGWPRSSLLRPDAAAAALHVAGRPKPARRLADHTANRFTDETAPFDVDQLTLSIDASVATLYANVG